MAKREALAYKDDVEHFPFSRGFARVRGRSGTAVERCTATDIWRLAIAVKDLNFVSIAHVDTRVAAGHNLELNVEFKIIKILIGLKVRPFGLSGVDSILDFPEIRTVGLSKMPALKIFSVEERNPAIGTQVARGRRSNDQ